MKHSRTIRKITVGTDPKDAMAFQLGQYIGRRDLGFKITYIKEDSQHYEEFGITRYTVYVSNGEEVEVEWKS